MTVPPGAASGPPGPVRILFLDVDGTLTDGVITESAVGDSRNFWVRDGLALLWARELGLLPVVISGRPSPARAFPRSSPGARTAPKRSARFEDTPGRAAARNRVGAARRGAHRWRTSESS